jgi:hypothetical protein
MTDLCAEVPLFVICTVAPATTAPEGSCTVPTKVPYVDCAKAAAARRNVTNPRIVQRMHGRRMSVVMLLPQLA